MRLKVSMVARPENDIHFAYDWRDTPKKIDDSRLAPSQSMVVRVDSVAAAEEAAPAAAAPAIVEGAACYLRPGDPGFEECEVCQ